MNPGPLNRLDRAITIWMARHGVRLLRVSLGVVFLWFGVLKFFPGLSPATELATRTIAVLTFGTIPGAVAINVLAAWEALIGVGMIFGIAMRATIALLMVPSWPSRRSPMPRRSRGNTSSRTSSW